MIYNNKVIKDCLIYWYYLDVIFIYMDYLYFCVKIIRICEIMVLMEIMFFLMFMLLYNFKLFLC